MKLLIFYTSYIFFASYFFLLLLASKSEEENTFWIKGYINFLEWHKICISNKNCLQPKFQLTLYKSNDSIVNRIDFLNIENLISKNQIFFSMYFENITENDLSISSTVLGVNSVYNISTICDVSNLIQSFWSLSINSSFINVILKGECFIASIALEKKLQKCFWCTKTTKIIENFKNWNESNFTIYFPFEYILIVLIVIILIFFAITITLLNLLIKDKLSDNICISMKSYKIQNYNITMTTDSKFNKLFFKDNFKESSKKEDILIKHNTKNVKTCLKNYSLNQDISTSILKPYISTQNVYQQKSISNDKKFLPKIQFNESIKSSNSRVQSWINYREMWNTNIYCNTSPTKFNETGTSLFGGAVGYSDTPISSRNVLNNYF